MSFHEMAYAFWARVQSLWNYPIHWEALFWYALYGAAAFMALMAIAVTMAYLSDRNDRKYGKPE